MHNHQVPECCNTMITGQHVILRPATPGDRKMIYEWLAASDLTSKMLGPPHFCDNAIPTREEFNEDHNPDFFDDNHPDTGRSYVIESEGMPVGHINYNEIDRNTKTVELDVWLAAVKYCNKDYGTDAINALVKYLEDRLYCRTCILAPSARNKAAVRAYEKCGFQKSGMPPGDFIPDYNDTVVMIKRMGGR